ncbi:SPOR domain-containing protein [Alcanivorax sp. DP30]|uniref:SPOR domain-containing protein n=1 Tax=Alcanivorax sp. DP30 TaxID=2606217 RepID=UPI00136B246C|nr:SPOR domain-containing protein [Alcanivorax sp. DP30]MZR62573.1 cell division protein [Alcanivorax sp. DP30]
MAKNTRRGASRSPAKKKNTQRQVPGWVWLFTGLMVGLFGAFLFHLGKTQLQQAGQQTASKPQPKVEKPTPKKDEPKAGEDSPQFDFYAVLPKMEVIVPQNETDSGTRQTSTTKPKESTRQTSTETSTRSSDEKYLLQAGSFRRNEDADRRRAELILKGFEASIQSVNLENGDSWHRVMIGPYNNLNAMHRAQDQLASNGIETLPIKMKK